MTLDIEWRYSPYEADLPQPTDSYRFYSPYISNMQRTENGNTLINEGSNGRIFEVTRDHEIVWEYISPFWGKTLNNNMVYRAYRIPYAWIRSWRGRPKCRLRRLTMRTLRQPGARQQVRRRAWCASPACSPTVRAPMRCAWRPITIPYAAVETVRVAESRFTPLNAESELSGESESPPLLFVGAERCVHVSCGSCWVMRASRTIWRRWRHAISMPIVISTGDSAGVRGLPALLMVKSGQPTARAPADLSVESLLDWLQSAVL